MLAALSLAFVGCVHAADVVIFGDSWGVYGRRAFHDLMEKKGLTVDNRAIAASTASFWATNGFETALKSALDDNRDAKYVWLTIGGNDIIPKFVIGEDTATIMAQTVADTRVFLDKAFEAYPNIKVVQFGYDLLDFEDNNPVCNVLGWQVSKTYCGIFPTRECQNELVSKIQTLYVDKLSTYYPNHYSVNLLGALQAAAGVRNAAIGRPNFSEQSPTEFMDPSCIHLTEEGYEIMFEALWNKWFADQEAARRGVTPASLEINNLRGHGGQAGPYRPGQYIGMAAEQIGNTFQALWNWG